MAIENLIKYKRIYFILLLPVGVLLSYVCSFFPPLVERIYSTGFYQAIIHILSIITGFLPFSLAEILVVLIAVALMSKIIWIIFNFLKGSQRGKAILPRFFLNLVIFFSIAYFAFVLLWGLNYNRQTFADLAHLKVQPASTEELANLCDKLIDRTNLLRTRVNVDQNGVMKMSGAAGGILDNASAGYQKAAAHYPQLGGRYGKPKEVLFSEAMAYTGISGVYCPYTGEANVNMTIPDALLPCTICHEMAHQRGFAREDEANYIAYITSNLNPEIDFQYSGTLLALINSMNMLRDYDPEKYQQLQKRYSQEVRADLEDINAYWQEYNGIFTSVTNNVNNLYLKSNHQGEGVYSYNRMVDLLLAEYRVQKRTGELGNQ